MKNILNLKNMTQLEVEDALDYLDSLVELHNKMGHHPISFSEAAGKECSKGIEYYIYSVLGGLVKTKEHNWLEKYEHVTRSSSYLRPHYLENLYWHEVITSYKDSLESYSEYCAIAVNTLSIFKDGLENYKGGNAIELIVSQGDFIVKSIELESAMNGTTDHQYKTVRVVKDILSLFMGKAIEQDLFTEVGNLLESLKLREYVYLGGKSRSNTVTISLGGNNGQ